LQSELESVVKEKSCLKTRLNQLEQDLINLQAQKSLLENENIEKTRKERILETELNNLKKIQEEEAGEKENKAKETATEIFKTISKLKTHVIKLKEEFEALKQ
jgi:hypothetical protein